MTENIPVDVSNTAATLQSAMNALILAYGSADEIPADFLLKIALVQSTQDLVHSLDRIRYELDEMERDLTVLAGK